MQTNNTINDNNDETYSDDANEERKDTLSDEEYTRRLVLYEASRHDTFTGTPQFMAPETIEKKIPTGGVGSIDLWSYGILIYQLISGILPYDDPSEYKIFQKILSKDKDFIYKLTLDNLSWDIPTTNDVNVTTILDNKTSNELLNALQILLDKILQHDSDKRMKEHELIKCDQVFIICMKCFNMELNIDTTWDVFSDMCQNIINSYIPFLEQFKLDTRSQYRHVNS